jgi:soluble lytic murein transglycosylase-like protein
MTLGGSSYGVSPRAGGAQQVAQRGASARPRTVVRWWILAAAAVAIAASPVDAEVFSFRDRRGVQHFTNVPTDSRYRAMPMQRARVMRISYTRTDKSAAARRGVRTLARSDRIWREAPADLDKLIDQTARRYGVETALVHSVVRAESAFDHLAVSSAGAQGLMQLMPGTAFEVGVRDAFHPEQNLAGGVYYLRQLIDRFNGNVQLALAGYNAGPGAVERFGGVPPYAETIEYLQRVFRYRQEYILSRKPDRQRVVVASR